MADFSISDLENVLAIADDMARKRLLERPNFARDNAPASASMSAYEPTVRDRIGAFAAGDAPPGTLRHRLARELFGTTGVGEPTTSAVDFTPAGPGLMSQEAAQRGRYPEAVAYALPAAAPALGPAARAAGQAARGAPKTALATGGALGYLSSTSEAGDVTPSADPLSAVTLPREPQRPAPYAIPEMPADIQKAGPRRRQAWIEEQKSIKAATDATADAAYRADRSEWERATERIKNSTLERVAGEETRRANRPMREQFPAAFWGLTYAPAALSGASAFKAMRGRMADVAAKQNLYAELEQAAAARAIAGKKPTKAMTEALANKPPMEAHKPWETIAEGTAAGPVGPMLPYMFDYQSLKSGSEGKEEAEKNLFTVEALKQAAIGAGKGFGAGYMGAAAASALPQFRFRFR